MCLLGGEDLDENYLFTMEKSPAGTGRLARRSPAASAPRPSASPCAAVRGRGAAPRPKYVPIVESARVATLISVDCLRRRKFPFSMKQLCW